MVEARSDERCLHFAYHDRHPDLHRLGVHVLFTFDISDRTRVLSLHPKMLRRIRKDIQQFLLDDVWHV